jgi:outer membrane protein TolC
MATTNTQLLVALARYDECMATVKSARDDLRDAERELKRLVGAKYDTYMDGNELVAALGRRLAENLSKGDS